MVKVPLLAVAMDVFDRSELSRKTKQGNRKEFRFQKQSNAVTSLEPVPSVPCGHRRKELKRSGKMK